MHAVRTAPKPSLESAWMPPESCTVPESFVVPASCVVDPSFVVVLPSLFVVDPSVPGVVPLSSSGTDESVSFDASSSPKPPLPLHASAAERKATRYPPRTKCDVFTHEK
jgi:hypothetical protein